MMTIPLGKYVTDVTDVTDVTVTSVTSSVDLQISTCRDAHGRLLAGVREAGGLKKAGEAAERCGRDEWFQYVPIGEIGSNVFVALGPL